MKTILSLLVLLFSTHSFADNQVVLGGAMSLRLMEGESFRLEYTLPREKVSLFKQQKYVVIMQELPEGSTVEIPVKKDSLDSAVVRSSLIKNKLLGHLKLFLKGKEDQLLNVLVRRSPNSETLLQAYDSPNEAFAAQSFFQDLEKLQTTTADLQAQEVTLNRQQTGLQQDSLSGDILQSFLDIEGDGQRVIGLEAKINAMTAQENQRRIPLMRVARASSPEQIQRGEAKAKALMSQAFLLTRNRFYKRATSFFKEATLEVPLSELIYQHWGLSLYRNEEYIKALAVLRNARTQGEKKELNLFYQAMAFYKLKEWKLAESAFQPILTAQSANIKVKSHFYLGLVLQKMKRFDEAQTSFQYVLDHSNDPKLDEKAEKYIEWGLKRKAQEESKKKRWAFGATLGLIYDSNIVLALDGQANQQTDQEGVRALVSGNTQYRYFMDAADELSVKADFTLLRSQKTDLSDSAVLQAADPWVYGASLPWAHRGQFLGTHHSFELAPRYEVISMDLDNTTQKDIIHSMVLDVRNKWVMDSHWVLTTDLQVRQDDANAETGTITDEADAFQWSLQSRSILVLNKQKGRYLIPHIGVTSNQADGDDFAYNRWDVSLSYTQPVWLSLVWNSRLGYYQSDYRSERLDKNLNVSTGVSYAISGTTQWGMNVSYQDNDSNTNSFQKYQVLSTLGFGF